MVYTYIQLANGLPLFFHHEQLPQTRNPIILSLAYQICIAALSLLAYYTLRSPSAITLSPRMSALKFVPRLSANRGHANQFVSSCIAQALDLIF